MESNPEPKEPTFHDELRALINKHSKESGSDTPDFLLANFLEASLKNFDEIIRYRERWYGRGNSNDR